MAGLSLQKARRSQSGLSLIELLIASALGILIAAALAELFVDISRDNQELANTNSQIENARFAMQFMEDDVVHAGYWGGHVPTWDDITYDVGAPTDVPTSTPTPNPLDAPCTAFSVWDNTYKNSAIGLPLVVYDAVPTGCGTQLADWVSGTDILLVRHASTCIAGDPNCEAFDSNKLYMKVSNCATELDAGILYQLDPNDPNDLTELNCTTVAGNRKFEQTFYYVRSFGDTGDGIPTLVRSQLDYDAGSSDIVQGAAVPLVSGIEDLRVEVGIDSANAGGDAVDYTSVIGWIDELTRGRVFPDNRGNGIPDADAITNKTYYHCPTESPAGTTTPCDIADFQDVVVAKIYVLSRASQTSPGYTDEKAYALGGKPVAAKNDEFKRHVYSRTIRLNNVSSRRETPYDPLDPNNP